MALEVIGKLKSHPVEMDVDTEKVISEDGVEGDLYTTLKNLQRNLAFLEIQVQSAVCRMTGQASATLQSRAACSVCIWDCLSAVFPA